MWRANLSLMSILLCTLAGVLALSTRPAEVLIPAKDRIVVLISLDGFPAWAFEGARLPVLNLRKLARHGEPLRSA